MTVDNPSSRASDVARGWHLAGLLAVALLVVGSWIGLAKAPPERHMGDVSRILYVHLPVALNCLGVYTLAFGFAIASLWTSRPRWDARTAAALEVGAVLNVLMLVTGMIWARPTWGAWWVWDVRVTTAFVALILFGGILALRGFLDDPDRRGTWTAVATIIAYVDVPLIYFCVRWWRSLHQTQSSPETVDSAMVTPLRINLLGMLLLALWWIALRSADERRRLRYERSAEPPARVAEVAG